MFVHDVPTTRAISYADYLHTSNLGTEVSQTTEKRSKLQQTLKLITEQKKVVGGSKDVICLLSQKEWIKLVQNVDDYLPFLYSVYNSIKTDDLLLKGELRFSWTTTLSAASPLSSSSKVTLPGIQYELLSVLILQGKSLCNFAASLVDSLGRYEEGEAATLSNEARKQKEDRLKFAADLQCRAAGIFEHVGRQIIPEWENSEGTSKLSEIGRSVETTGELAFALSKLAHAEAELLAIRKLLSPCLCYLTAHHTSYPPLSTNHPSPSLLSKLYFNVSALYESALSLSQIASSKAGVRSESMPSSSATDANKKDGHAGGRFGAALKQKMSNRSSSNGNSLEETTTSGKISNDFAKYLFKGARGSRARGFFWLGVDRGERGQYGEALSFFRLATDEMERSSSGKRIILHKSEKVKEEKKEFARDKESLLQLIGQFSTSYKQLNDSVAFQPVPNASSLTSQIPAGRSAMGIKVYLAPLPAFGPGSVEAVSSDLRTLHGVGSDVNGSTASTGDAEAAGQDYAGRGAYY
ncbi:hypothetical protein CBS101457_003957 [Exobasidium rhododendri]|nr:hypothetical protein CBS101457_003957 [Exobasidium rhododendri]